MTATATVRTTVLGVYIHDGTDWQYDSSCYAASCSFGFDQRVAAATVRRTGGGVVNVNYWSPIEIRMGTTPGLGEAVRFNGYVVPVDNSLFPIEAVLTCKGNLYRAQWVRNQEEDGTDLAGAGTADEDQVLAVLAACGVTNGQDGGPVTSATVGGTGKALGSVYNGDPADVFTAGPFWWARGEPGLSVIERLDEVSVPDDASGRYRTFESLGGTVFRIKLSTTPTATPDFTFTEGVDVLEARITRDPAGAANKVTVNGSPLPVGSLPGVVATETFTAGTSSAPYLPPGLPDGPDGWPAVGMSFSSPLIEKSEIADPGDVVACEAVAQFLLAEYNCVVDTLEFSTPRDDLLGPGQTIHLHSPRLGITEPDQHYWLQRLEITLDESGAFTQRLTCLRKS
jgi:hypothetical protein